MIDTPMTTAAARNAARAFVRYVERMGDVEWTVDTAASFLPEGWELNATVADDYFHPVTIANVADTFRNCTHRAT